jgi:xylan 1,4-beta-xylosidase
MQLMCDGIAVLGSRHGLIFDPIKGELLVARFDAFAEAPRLAFRAGVVVDGREFVFPLCPDGTRFAFYDQRITPCTTRFIAIEEHSGLKVSLTFATPFRPRDAAFSTTPVLGIRLELERLAGNYRWTPVTVKPSALELFVEIGEGDLQTAEAGPLALDLRFRSRTLRRREDPEDRSGLEQTDRLLSRSGRLQGRRFSFAVPPSAEGAAAWDLFWCTHSGPVLEVQGRRHPFRYQRRFAALADVATWALAEGGSIFENARHVDAIVEDEALAPSIRRLLAQTLHSWLLNTWWVDRDGADWFSVWEGSCHFHSTLDVEFTQSPFYLAVWPELLGIQLRMWPEFAKEGGLTLGERGKGTLFLSHDCGAMARANGQEYPHEMEVEETTNYIILLYAHWRRTGDFSIARLQIEALGRFLAFLDACDSRGRGIPDLGVANTLDDGSPALQFGREQVYLAVKTMAAYACGASLLEAAGDQATAERQRKKAGLIRGRVEKEGWKDDHYVCLLCRDARGLKNPWTGQELPGDVVPGWDGYHIYTANGLAPLDMVGFDSGLDPERLAADLRNAAARCLGEYGCSHSDYVASDYASNGVQDGMVGVSARPGWISMNLLRDVAAFYRGVDFRPLAERYWEWQVTTNSQAPALFFETFGGNNLHFYPRGVAVWGFFDALAGRVVDRVAGVERCRPGAIAPGLPNLLAAQWGPVAPPATSNG